MPIKPKEAAKAIANWNGPVYLSVWSSGLACVLENQPFEIGKGLVLKRIDVAAFLQPDTCFGKHWKFAVN